jgi:5-methylcytosine-specific restriction endonuclease McrA
MSRACAQCGAEFEPVKEFRSYRRRYCSIACAGQAHHDRTVRRYPAEGEVRELYVGQGMTDRELGRHYGRSYHWALTVRRHYGLPAHKRSDKRKPLNQRKDRARWAISRKPAPACRNCGRGGLLHLHHAVPRSLSPAGKYDLRNGIQLCTRCHLGWHNRRCTITRDIFVADEWAFVQTLIGPSWLDRRYPPPEFNPRRAA